MDGRGSGSKWVKRSPARQLEHVASRWLLVAKGIGMLIGWQLDQAGQAMSKYERSNIEFALIARTN